MLKTIKKELKVLTWCHKYLEQAVNDGIIIAKEQNKLGINGITSNIPISLLNI
jgi:hypothetical protein